MSNNAYNVLSALLDYEDTSLDYTREVSCFALPSYGIVSMTSNNSAGSVEFDWFTIKDKIWELKGKGLGPEVAYMLHTHPPALNRMSSIDKNMVHGWCMALGIPIWFLVLTEDQIVSYICSLNHDTKKVDIDLVDLISYENVCVDLRLMSSIMYGMSKTYVMNDVILNNISSQISNGGLNFGYIHNWNETREWNQVITSLE